MPALQFAIALTLVSDQLPSHRRLTPSAVGTMGRPTAIEPMSRRLPLMVERKQVFDIPLSIVTLARPESWTPPATDPTTTPSALHVARVRPSLDTPCEPFIDYIDLVGVRRNNFRLVGYDVESMPPPPGYTLQSPAEGVAVDTSTRDTPTSDLPRAGQLRIRPPVHVGRVPSPQACISRYRVSITLEGPRGADPFAGLRYQDRRPRRREPR